MIVEEDAAKIPALVGVPGAILAPRVFQACLWVWLRHLLRMYTAEETMADVGRSRQYTICILAVVIMNINGYFNGYMIRGLVVIDMIAVYFYVDDVIHCRMDDYIRGTSGFWLACQERKRKTWTYLYIKYRMATGLGRQALGEMDLLMAQLDQQRSEMVKLGKTMAEAMDQCVARRKTKCLNLVDMVKASLMTKVHDISTLVEHRLEQVVEMAAIGKEQLDFDSWARKYFGTTGEILVDEYQTLGVDSGRAFKHEHGYVQVENWFHGLSKWTTRLPRDQYIRAMLELGGVYGDAMGHSWRGGTNLKMYWERQTVLGQSYVHVFSTKRGRKRRLLLREADFWLIEPGVNKALQELQ